jgi:uncharacterized membrane protein YedE/YeeE
MENFLLIGFFVGFLLGFVIQRGSFCMYNGFANAVITKDYRIIKATIWAFLLTMLSFHVLASLNFITLNPKPFFWLGSILGAFLFGIGMVLAGSCIVGAPLRAASGKMGYWLTLLGMGIGGWFVIWGPWANFRVQKLQEATKVLLDGKTATLDSLFNVNHWIVVAILSLISIWILFILKDKKKNDKKSFFDNFFKNLWTPVTIGVSLAIIEVFAFLSGKSPAGLGGFIKGWASYFDYFFTGELSFGWPVTMVTGILVGVFVAAIISREFRIIWPKMKQLPRLFFGGVFMGIGAVIAAGGCNVAHIISHMPQLSIGSFISGIVIVFTSVGLIKIVYLRK